MKFNFRGRSLWRVARDGILIILVAGVVVYTGYHFMLVEIAGDELHFQVISDTGRTVDSGVIRRPPDPESASRIG